MYRLRVLLVLWSDSLDAATIITVSHISVYNELTSHIHAGDILVAVNGMCMGVLPPTCRVKQWQSTFMASSYPRMITLFRYDPSYRILFNADQVR